jgi:hypothetical protein
MEAKPASVPETRMIRYVGMGREGERERERERMRKIEERKM